VWRLPIVEILTPRHCRSFWLSIGAGDFSISPKATSGTAFFVMIQEAPPVLSTGAASGKAKLKRDGVAEFCVDVPLKPPLLATLKSTNYLLNALACMQAEDRGGYLGVQVAVPRAARAVPRAACDTPRARAAGRGRARGGGGDRQRGDRRRLRSRPATRPRRAARAARVADPRGRGPAEAGRFLTPPFDNILAGTTARRAFALGGALVERCSRARAPT